MRQIFYRFLFIALIIISLFGPLFEIQAQEIPLLRPEKEIEKQIKAEEVHSYNLSLQSGQFLYILVEQKGIDIAVELSNGKSLIKIDNQSGIGGVESLYWITEENGDYKVLISSAQKGATTGNYKIIVKALRAAIEQDKSCISAQKIFSEALELENKGTRDSRLSAVSKYEEALHIYRTIGDRYGEIVTLNSLGYLYNVLGERQKALDFYSQGLPLRRAVGDRYGEAHTLSNIGGLNNLLGEQEKALDYFNQALPLRRAVGDRYGEAITLNNIGAVYNVIGEEQKALDSYNQSLLLYRALGDRGGEAQALSNIGIVYNNLGEQQKALDYFNQSIPLKRAVGDRRGEAHTLNNIGVQYNQLGESEKALEYYNQSLSLRRATGDRYGEAESLTNIGNVYNNLGEQQKALDYYNQALPLRRAVGDRRGEAGTLHSIANAYKNLGEKEKAVEFYNQALALRRAVGDRIGEAGTLYYLAQVKRGSGELKEAQVYIEGTLEIVEFLRNRVTSQQLRTSYFTTAGGYYEFYIDLLMQLHKEDPLARYDAIALSVSERAKARSLLELLRESRADIRQGVDTDLINKESSLQLKLNAKAERLIQLKNSRAIENQIKEAEKEIDSITTELQDLLVQIKQKSPGYAALTQPQPLSLKRIQQLLNPNTLLLEYSLGEEKSYLWAVSTSSISSYELPKRSQIEASVNRLYPLLVNRSPLKPDQSNGSNRNDAVNGGREDLQKVSEELSQLILGPAVEQIKGKRLLIVPDGALHYIPFSALPIPSLLTDEAYRPLILEHEIVNLPSASTLAILREQLAGRKQADKEIAVLADPVFDKDDNRVKVALAKSREDLERKQQQKDEKLEEIGMRIIGEIGVRDSNEKMRIARLPFTRREAEGILSILPKTSILRAIDFKASKQTAISGELSDYKYIHFATHGYLDKERPELSAIVLSLVDENGSNQDGFLRLNDILNLKLNAEVVVLSACQTGLGKEIRGEGLVGLTRSFMYAGSARIVASLWKVDDSATAELMKLFYQGMIKDKLTPAQALRSAQIAMLKKRQWEHPFFWAAFQLQGENY